MLVDNGDGTFSIKPSYSFDKQEPVAWIDEETNCFVYSQSEYEELSEYDKGGLIPLYTAPRELSDEEIRQIYIETMESPYTHQQSYFGFARAVLRKAQEK